MIAVSPPCAAFLYDQYDKIFGSPWPVIPSALVIAAVNVFLFAFDQPWAASDGLRNWSNGLLQLFGLIPALLPQLLYSGSCLNLGLLFGGDGITANSCSHGFDQAISFLSHRWVERAPLGPLCFSWRFGISYAGWNEQRKQSDVLKR